MSRSIKRSAAEWKAIIDEFRNSGTNLSSEEWCEQKGINYKTFRGWEYKFYQSDEKIVKSKRGISAYERNAYINIARELCYPDSTI